MAARPGSAYSGNGHELIDLGSTNGTFVNGRRLSSVLLKPGDRVPIGPYKLVYQCGGFEKSSSKGSVRLDGVQIPEDGAHREGPQNNSQ